MHNVITEQEAREITGGRKPLVPLEYERACKDLILCQTIDEAKYFSEKADALAAWAKIYKDDQAGLEARRLKLHAYRRMGELASELRPGGVYKVHPDRNSEKRAYARRKRLNLPSPNTPLGSQPGPRSLLVEHGMSEAQAGTVMSIARLPSDEFDLAVNSPRPPSPTRLKEENQNNYAWRELSQHLFRVENFISKNNPRSLAAMAVPTTARRLCLVISEWLDEFERHLPKSSPSETDCG